MLFLLRNFGNYQGLQTVVNDGQRYSIARNDRQWGSLRSLDQKAGRMKQN